MNLTDELEKLAGLHQGGQLTDGEFAAAKARLLEQEGGAHPFEPVGRDQPSPSLRPTRPDPPSVPVVLNAPPPAAVQRERKSYRSSRWSSGNLFFPDRLTLAADGLHFRKGALFGSEEEHIAYRAIASLRVDNGILLSNLTVETSGGSQPVHINGLWKSAAREIQAAVQAVQSTAQR